MVDSIFYLKPLWYIFVIPGLYLLLGLISLIFYPRLLIYHLLYHQLLDIRYALIFYHAGIFMHSENLILPGGKWVGMIQHGKLPPQGHFPPLGLITNRFMYHDYYLWYWGQCPRVLCTVIIIFGRVCQVSLCSFNVLFFLCIYPLSCRSDLTFNQQT